MTSVNDRQKTSRNPTNRNRNRNRNRNPNRSKKGSNKLLRIIEGKHNRGAVAFLRPHEKGVIDHGF